MNVQQASETPSNAVAIVGGQRIAAQTQAGTDYVRKVTHPPTTIPSGYGGIPDASQPNFVPLEIKCSTNIPQRYSLGSSATTTTNYDASRILLVQPSGGLVGSYVFYWTGSQYVQVANQPAVTSTQPALSGNVPAATNVGYNFDNWQNDVDQTRTAYKSTTVYLNATEFSDQGTVTAAKFKPNIIKGIYANLRATMHSDERKSFDRCFRRIQQARVESEEGFDVVKLGTSDFDYDVQIWDFPNNAGVITYPLSTFSNNASGITGLLPESPADVLVASPKGTEHMARDGGFVVQQPINTVQLWESVHDTSSQTGPQIPLGGVFSMIRCNVGSTVTYAPLFNGKAGSAGAIGWSDTPWNNLDWSYIMFDGLTIPSAGSNAPYLTIKGFTGLEVSPLTTGSLLSFQKMLPLPDPEALQMAAGIFHARPDMLPAVANDWGTIGRVALQYLPTAITWLRDIFAKARGGTVAAPRAPAARIPAARAMARAAIAAAAKRTRRPKRNPKPAPQVTQQLNNITRTLSRMQIVPAARSANVVVQPAYTNATAFGNVARTRTRVNAPLQPLPRRNNRNPATRRPY